MDDTSGRVTAGTENAVGRSPETTRGYAGGEGDAAAEQRTRELRHEIEDTRGEMTETIDAIQEKLKPRNVMAQATDRAKSAATERVREMADTASHTAQQAMDYTRERASGALGTARQNPIPLALLGLGTAWLLTTQSRRSASYERSGTMRSRYDRDDPEDYSELRREWDDDGDSGIMGRIRNNPIPAALAGVGIGWLAFSSSERDDDRRWSREYRSGSTARWRTAGEEQAESARHITARTTEYAGETADTMKRMARRRQSQLQRMIQENPLLVGAGALMIGAAFGLAVPETEAENEWLGETRDNVVNRARDAASDAADQVREVADTVTNAAQKLTGKTQS